MKTYEHELAHFYEHRKSAFGFSSASLLQSLITASVIGVVVAFIGVALDAVRWHGNTSWYVSATTAAVVEMVVVTALVTIVLEQRRKRAIRRTLELAFLNHHIRNAVTQISMLQYVPDTQQHERLVRDSIHDGEKMENYSSRVESHLWERRKSPSPRALRSFCLGFVDSQRTSAQVAAA